MSRLDLHLHTTFSDGSQTPTDVLALAGKAQVTALAITDHDTVAGLPEAIAAGHSLGIEVIPGIELSSRWGQTELHILGYFLDWKDLKLQRQLTRFQDARHVRNPRMIEKLNALGIDLTYEEVRLLAGHDSVGRP